MAYAGVGPEIQFKDKAIDFGTVSGGEIGNCTFIFTNTGDETLSSKVFSHRVHVLPQEIGPRMLNRAKPAPSRCALIPSHFNGAVSKAVVMQCNAQK